MSTSEMIDRAVPEEIFQALQIANRPGAACLFFAVLGLIQAKQVPDVELAALGKALARQALARMSS